MKIMIYSMFLNQLLFLFFIIHILKKYREIKKTPKGELIVVATLIDKIPNLANLTRTCEIFGVSELVIPNKDIINDESFKNIAVTAEKWIQLVEIKEVDLLSFLMLKKNLGFKVNYFLLGFSVNLNKNS